MLSQSQRERILSHLERGWKLPDSLVQELWIAYESLERSQPRHSDANNGERDHHEHRSLGGKSRSPAM